MWQMLLTAFGMIKELIVARTRGIRRFFTTSKLLERRIKREKKDLQAKKKDLQAKVEILQKDKQELEDILHKDPPKVDSKFDPRDPDDN